jgi:hypothetical protein
MSRHSYEIRIVDDITVINFHEKTAPVAPHAVEHHSAPRQGTIQILRYTA